MQFGLTAAVTLTSILSVIQAQTYYTTNPNNIDTLTKQTWCSDQIASCTLLCLDQNSGGGYTNTCDPDNLSWQCVCADGTVPNATQYTQTIPYFICTDEVQNCVNNCPQADATCAQTCVNGKVCGATDPKRVTTSKAAGSHTATGTSVPSASGTSGTNSGDDTPYDAPTGSVAPGSTQTPSSSNNNSNNKSNAGTKLASVPGAAFSVMILSLLCGSFVVLL